MIGGMYGQYGRSDNSEQFPDPFLDVASRNMPDTMRNTLHWSEYIHSIFGTLRMAMERIASYFITDLDILGDEVSEDDKDKYRDFLNKTIKVKTQLQIILKDLMCYGNSFTSLIVPFRRYLLCPKSGDMYPLRVVVENFKFEWKNFEFVATCPKTGWRGPWIISDKMDNEPSNVTVKRWPVHEIELLHDPYTDEVDYLWRIPEDYQKLIKDGNLMHLERCPEEVLKAIKEKKRFRFHPGLMYHMKEPSLCGIRMRGWGLPRILSNYRQIYYTQVLKRMQEAIALDYVIPFRLLTPQNRGGTNAGGLNTGDPLQMFNGGDFKNQVLSMIRRRRRDPSSWQVLPYAVEYHMLGGDAKQLAPKELLDQAMEQLLNDFGIPMELYKGSLQLQTAPVALRLFEATWQWLVDAVNDFINWLLLQTSQVMQWEPVEATMKRITIADDAQKQMAGLQLMTGQQISGKTGLGLMGFDWKSEQKQIAEESREQQEIQSRVQEEMEQAGFAQQIAKGQPDDQGGGGDPGGGGGAPPPGGGGAPPQGGGAPPGGDPSMGGGAPQTPINDYIQSLNPTTPVTPEDMKNTAEQLAQQLLALDSTQRASQLRQLKQYNEVLHSLVTAAIERTRSSARSQGQAMVMQQMQQGGGGG